MYQNYLEGSHENILRLECLKEYTFSLNLFYNFIAERYFIIHS